MGKKDKLEKHKGALGQQVHERVGNDFIGSFEKLDTGFDECGTYNEKMCHVIIWTNKVGSWKGGTRCWDVRSGDGM